MMGGSGTRFGADVPKQFIKVNGKPIFSYVVEKYDSTLLLDEMVIVCHESWIEFTRSWI
jgi:2-C-methyl-D-erythritol 4-phosphate cytidylyltransferase